MIKEILKKLGYDDDAISKIENALNADKVYLTKEENIEVRYSKLKSQNEELQGKYTNAENTIATLRKSNKDNEELQKEINTYKEKAATIEKDAAAKIRNLTIDNAVNAALTKHNATYTELLTGKIDREKIVIGEDGTITGIDDQIESLKTNYSTLFAPAVIGTTPPAPDSKVNNTWNNIVNAADNMTSEEVAQSIMSLNNNNK